MQNFETIYTFLFFLVKVFKLFSWLFPHMLSITSIQSFWVFLSYFDVTQDSVIKLQLNLKKNWLWSFSQPPISFDLVMARGELRLAPYRATRPWPAHTVGDKDSDYRGGIMKILWSMAETKNSNFHTSWQIRQGVFIEF